MLEFMRTIQDELSVRKEDDMTQRHIYLETAFRLKIQPLESKLDQLDNHSRSPRPSNSLHSYILS